MTEHVFEASGTPPTEESRLTIRPTTVSDPDGYRMAVLQVLIEDEAHDEGKSIYLHPTESVGLSSFMSNIEQKLMEVEEDDLRFSDWGGNDA